MKKSITMAAVSLFLGSIAVFASPSTPADTKTSIKGSGSQNSQSKEAYFEDNEDPQVQQVLSMAKQLNVNQLQRARLLMDLELFKRLSKKDSLSSDAYNDGYSYGKSMAKLMLHYNRRATFADLYCLRSQWGWWKLLGQGAEFERGSKKGYSEILHENMPDKWWDSSWSIFNY